ncbi:UBC-like protein [Lepidopterella palustris CBS 459.81]|uniref:UBC-like protein n=1 Tax=Lepidopterella palustris CBS 459.81 TaxID=1314670 RepID=A0A8E2EKT5_9PEZI|nr:UBC-like protein [Lepidopterella palustris CBS 459.81]
MSTRGQFNTKNPTIKRILKEASELSSNPSPDLHAEPLEDNLFEWHFTLRGPPDPSAYSGGIYHGRIILPPTYPLRPPSFRFLTPTGRFEVNREICLSISGHHEETWQPAWGIRTAMVAIRSFMDTDAKGQLGGIECNEQARRKMAGESAAWRCAGCGRSNGEIMKEKVEAVKAMEASGEKRKEEVVPDELRLAYRDELGKDGAPKTEKELKVVDPTSTSGSSSQSSRQSPPASNRTTAPQPTRTVQPPPPPGQQAAQRSPEGSPAWIDHVIYGILAALIFMILRKIL